ncbi:protein kinase, partial [candidate division KSB1 bacterium]|nr:protein kinase [candidate division KSB1 bacterium]
MPLSKTYICPKCGASATRKQIERNNYACPNSKCTLNERLVVHADLNTQGALTKLYGWILEKGTLLKKRYVIEGLLGKGGFGATYLAKDKEMFNQLRAIKEIPKAFFDEKEDQFLTMLNHPAIPKLYERFAMNSMHYSVMEYIEGPDLDELIRKSKSGLTEQQALPLIEQLFEVLSYIHSKKIIHRDLKPENILVRKDGSIALIDFGIAKLTLSGHRTRYLARAASNFYSPPEQYQPGKGFTDVKSDIYSLGAILYFTLTGREPIDALSRDASKDIYPTPRALNPEISARTETVIIKALKMNKGERYSSIGQLKKALLGKSVGSKKSCPKCGKTIEDAARYCPNCGRSTEPQRTAMAPAMVVQPDTIKLVNIEKGAVKRAIITIKNKGNGQLKGRIVSSAKWIEIQKTDFECPPGENSKILITIQTRSLSAKNYQAQITLRSNGGEKKIPIALNLVKPISRLQVTPGVLNLQLRSGETATATVMVRSIGSDETIKARIATPQRWIDINPKKINQKEKMIRIGISTRRLKAGNYSGHILIRSNLGRQQVPVSLRLEPATKQSKTNLSPLGILKMSLTPVLMTVAISLLILHFGPRSQPALSDPWLIVVLSALTGSLGMRRSPVRMVAGLILGGVLGAILNYVIYYTYHSVHEYL